MAGYSFAISSTALATAQTLVDFRDEEIGEFLDPQRARRVAVDHNSVDGLGGECRCG